MIKTLPFIVDRSIKFAIVGCGRISHNHIKAILMHNNNAELSALCDSQPEKLEEALTLCDEISTSQNISFKKPKSFTDYRELLDAVREQALSIDVVVITTPSGYHYYQTIDAARTGVNVITEKPMATKWSHGLEMVRACDEAGVRLFVVKQNRFNETLQLLKRQLLAKRFGKIALVNVNVFWQRPQSYYDQSAWRGTWELDGGALMNQASHYVDLLNWLIGPVDSISADIATIGRAIEAEDTAALHLRWRSGTLGTMGVTMLTYPKNLEGSITILGETGTVRIGGKAVNHIDEWTFKDESPDDILVENASYETSSVYGFGHFNYYADVIEVFRGGKPAMCDGREGLKSLEILTGAYLSARDKKRVYFPLDR